MDEAFDLSSVRRTLQRGLASGLWTMENLDEENKAPSSAKTLLGQTPNEQSIQDQTSRQSLEDIVEETE